MPWPVHPTGFFGAQGDNDTYRIERSLRFNSADSAYLNRTPASAGNRKTWTWSGWVKRGLINANFRTLFGVNNGTGSSYFALNITTAEALACSDSAGFYRVTNQVFRDPSAWYHIVCAVDTTDATANNRIRFYVNGSEITSFSTLANPSQNADLGINQSAEHAIGRIATDLRYFDGYLTEINFIDGQAMTPSSFGETDAITGRWKAKAYSGTYGTNGFYLKFADNSGTTATTLGKDSSSNGNNWTPNNFSVTAGAGNDSLVDSPTNYGTDTGVGGEVRGNFATWNPLNRMSGSIATITDGNLRAAPSSGTIASTSIQIPTTGKWYAEIELTNGQFPQIGIANNTFNGGGNNTGNYGTYFNGSYFVFYNGSQSNVGNINGISTTTNDVAIFAIDSGNGKVWLGRIRSGTTTWLGGGDPSLGTSPTFSSSGGGGVYATNLNLADGYYVFVSTGGTTDVFNLNTGQRAFTSSSPTGFKALCTTNLPQPTIQKPSRYMDVVAYTGTGASNSISSLGFSPDLVWIKNRGTTTSHAIYDTTRGTQAQLSSDTTGDEVTSSTGLTAFGSNGFTIGTSSLVNTSGTQYVAWAWDEAPIAGLDIVSYTGNGANRTISHNLGVAPKMLVVKARTTAGADQGWPVWHTSIANTTYLTLSTTSATTTGTDYWNSTSPTASVFSLGTNAAVNANNDTYIAYLFAEVEGFSRFGTFTGNGTTDNAFVWCGFRPKYVLAKRTDLSGKPWLVYDSARSLFNVNSNELRPNTNESDSGGSFSGQVDFLSNGFKIRSDQTPFIGEAGTFIFAAFAESPFKYARAR